MSILHSLFGMRRKSDAPPPDSRTSTHASPEDITRELGMMNLTGTQPQRHSQVQMQSQSQPPRQDGVFIGGFHPAMVGRNVPHGTPVRLKSTNLDELTPPHPGPPPVPPKVVTTSPADKRGISRTMEYALSSPSSDAARPSRPPPNSLQRPALDALRPRSDPVAYTRPAYRAQPAEPLSLFSDEDDQPSISVPSRPSLSLLSAPTLQVPISQSRGRSVSSPAASLSSDPPAKLTCSGFTKAGPRCKRQKNISALPLNATEWYCTPHLKEALEPEWFPVPGGDFVRYSLFIPEYLSPQARSNLRKEMLKKIGKADCPGYIYVLQAEDFSPDVLWYKPGRTGEPKRRHGEWSDRCPSQRKHLVHIYPWPRGLDTGSLVNANFEPAEPGIHSHRLEKLVLIELEDLAQYAQYLHPNFQDCNEKLKWEHFDEAVHNRKPLDRVPCVDCGSRHRELFPFPRAKSGPLVGRELQSVIVPVINRWATFLSLHAMEE